MSQEWGPAIPPWYGGLDAAISTWVAEARNCVWGQELTGGKEKLHAVLARDAEVKELDAWKQCKVFRPLQEGSISKAAVNTKWAPTWKMVGGRKGAKARLAVKGYEDPDMKGGNMSTSGRVSIRSSFLQVISLRAIANRKIWGFSV